jgi:hypothetical protein
MAANPPEIVASVAAPRLKVNTSPPQRQQPSRGRDRHASARCPRLRAELAGRKINDFKKSKREVRHAKQSSD